MKHIIAIWNTAGQGKSETIRQIANEFLLIYPTAVPVTPTTIPIPTNHDFRLVIKLNINGVLKTVAFESKGDPNTNLKDRLSTELALNYQCDIIFCTCRTRGETVNAVEYTAKNHNFDIIWTSTYQTIIQSNHLLVNQQKAKHIIELLNALKIL